jgi:hypothetical protein
LRASGDWQLGHVGKKATAMVDHLSGRMMGRGEPTLVTTPGGDPVPIRELTRGSLARRLADGGDVNVNSYAFGQK